MNIGWKNIDHLKGVTVSIKWELFLQKKSVNFKHSSNHTIIEQTNETNQKDFQTTKK